MEGRVVVRMIEVSSPKGFRILKDFLWKSFSGQPILSYQVGEMKE